ncbi:hypothetical protein XENOCAPTIV_029370 [Xenoophorus captivus]|uniref:Uncharacterized protein n=1 Tax=Xenoophorus captivus TaxID=1517983 RepID=A0ABV0SD68_9TELE
MSRAERESCQLEKEVAARSLELSDLRQEVDRLHGHSHPHTQGLAARMEEVERKYVFTVKEVRVSGPMFVIMEDSYHCVLRALTQQSSELQDTRMLKEFLERLELEDSQELFGGQYNLDQVINILPDADLKRSDYLQSHIEIIVKSFPEHLSLFWFCVSQPLHRDNSVPTLLEIQTSVVGDPLMETMGDPVEELREAVEMLNNTVRERGRSQSHDHAIQELLSKVRGGLVFKLRMRVEECLCSSKELSLDILEKETDMAVQCEPDHCCFEPLWDRLGHLETDYEIIREEVKEMEDQAAHLKELCLEKAHIFEVKIQSTLQAWNELWKSVMENRSHLQEFVELQGFFRSYLAMM